MQGSTLWIRHIPQLLSLIAIRRKARLQVYTTDTTHLHNYLPGVQTTFCLAKYFKIPVLHRFWIGITIYSHLNLVGRCNYINLALVSDWFSFIFAVTYVNYFEICFTSKASPTTMSSIGTCLNLGGVVQSLTAPRTPKIANANKDTKGQRLPLPVGPQQLYLETAPQRPWIQVAEEPESWHLKQVWKGREWLAFSRWHRQICLLEPTLNLLK